MKTILFGLLVALTSLSALAGPPVFSSGLDTVTLSDKECPAEIAALAPDTKDKENYHFLSASATVDGKKFAGCWTFLDAERVGVVYEDGDLGVIPLKDFKEGL